MKKFIWILTIILFFAAFLLRLYKYEINSSFDWDQNRDYGEVQKIMNGTPVILGPVAKGSGGFHLGSLYYYLLVPSYWIMDHSLYSLPLTSIVLDTFFAAAIFLLLHNVIGKKVAIATSIVWIVSWYLVSASRVSWNVALVPLWNLLTLISLYRVIKERSQQYFYSLGLLLGLSFHIHVSIIPLIPIFLALYFKQMKYTFKDWIIFCILAITPLIPLITFDIKHGFFNAHLLRNQLGSQMAARESIRLMLSMTMIKLGKVVSGIFLAKFVDNIYLGIITTLLAYTTIVFDKKLLHQLAGWSIIISIILILALGDYGFPEYYFSPVYLSIMLLYVSQICKLPKLLAYFLFIFMISCNLRQITTTASPFSLKYKYDLVSTLKQFQEPIDMHYQFDPGRDGGFGYLINLMDIKTDKNSIIKILLTDKLNSPLYINGELTRDLHTMGNFRSSLYIVQ